MKKSFLVLAACALCFSVNPALAGGPQPHHNTEKNSVGFTIGISDNSFVFSLGYAEKEYVHKPVHKPEHKIKVMPKHKHGCDKRCEKEIEHIANKSYKHGYKDGYKDGVDVLKDAIRYVSRY